MKTPSSKMGNFPILLVSIKKELTFWPLFKSLSTDCVKDDYGILFFFKTVLEMTTHKSGLLCKCELLKRSYYFKAVSKKTPAKSNII